MSILPNLTKESRAVGALTLAQMALTLFFPSPATWVMLGLLFAFFSYLAFLARHQKTVPDSGVNEPAYQQTLREHQLLVDSIHHYPMPYAIYDEQDQLVVWNQHYEKIYSRLFASLADPADAKFLKYADLVRSNAELDTPDDELEDYVQERVLAQRAIDGHVVDRYYPDLGWFRVTKYLIPSGGVAGIAIDISELKQREADLLQEIEHRQKLEAEIREIANTDALTGIANRRYFMEMAELEYHRSEQTDGELAVLMIDIDHFKNTNDTYGHAFGDEVIATVASIISTALVAEKYIVGRLGGEEFAVLLPDTGDDEAEFLANNIRMAIEEVPFSIDGNTVNETVSIGVAHRFDSELTLSSLMKHADDALYVSKREGRNLVSVAGRVHSGRSRKAG